jgi:CBS domain-containing protein
MDVKVVDLMSTNVAFVKTGDSLSAAARLMWECDCGAVPVVQEGSDRVISMITDRDICMATWTRDQAPSAIVVSEAMSQDLFHCAPDDHVASAERLMRLKQVRRIPVLNNERKLVGIISLADIVAQSAQPQTDGTRWNEVALAANGVAATLASICQPRPVPVEDNALS